MKSSVLKSDAPRWLRILIGILVPTVCLTGILILYRSGSPFICPFYALTHLYCPGCGSGRAATALIHLQFGKALRSNTLFVLYILPCAYYACKQYLRFVFRKDLLPWRDPPNWVYWGIAISFVLYWILRNIPVIPFCWLAPQ
jgi:uncharacterized membrane protein